MTKKNILGNIILSDINSFSVENDTDWKKMLEKRLKTLLSDKHLSIDEFAEMCNLPAETVKNVYYGRTTDPKISTVMKMANALNISVNCLMGHCSHTTEEKILLQNFRSCGKHGRSLISLTAKYEALTVKEERESHIKHKIPCIIPQGDILQGIDYSKSRLIEIETSKPEAYVSIQLTTNELLPLYCKDDIVLIENRFPKHNEYGVFYIGSIIFIRRYLEEEKQYRLECLHGIGSDMIYKRLDQIEYVGTCCGVINSE